MSGVIILSSTYTLFSPVNKYYESNVSVLRPYIPDEAQQRTEGAEPVGLRHLREKASQ